MTPSPTHHAELVSTADALTSPVLTNSPLRPHIERRALQLVSAADVLASPVLTNSSEVGS